ncbi:MAG: 50S ribosomal protein L9 [Flexilinea sp.]|nr:50S ribosomal protein L9 [Flexilinea sp.]
MKILLLKDVYHLGHAGDVKKVADGYGRNYLIPQGFAVLATPGALKQAENIRSKAEVLRKQLSSEMSVVAERINGAWITFASKAGETGKLYGSITSQMVADKISEKAGIEIDKRMIDIQPIRTLGEHKAHVRLTIDIVPVINVLVHREGETPNIGGNAEEAVEVVEEVVEAAAENTEA